MAQLIPESEVNLEALQAASIDRPPVMTGAPPPISDADNYQIGTLPVQLGLPGDLERTQLKGGPIFRLMPPPFSGQANSNSSNTSSLLRDPTFQTNQAQTQANAAAIAAQSLTGWQGSWVNSVNYSLGAIVEDSSDIVYVSLANQNLNNIPASSPAFWRPTGQVQFYGAWSSIVTYPVGALVDYSGQIYISILAPNLNQIPSSSPTYWSATGSASFAGTWSSGTSYTTGQSVLGSNGSLYVALQNSTAENPVSTTGFWQLLSGSVAVFGNWNNSSAYPIGAEVFYGNSVWIATTANTNQVPSAGSSFWELVSNLATAVGFQMVSNPDFQNGLTNYNVYDNNSTGNVTLSLVADTAAPGGFGQKLQIHVAAGGESPGLGGFSYNTALDSGVVILDHYHVGDTYIVSLWANIPTAYTIGFFNNSLGTGGGVSPLSASYAGTGGWVNYVWEVTIGSSPFNPNAFPFFALTGSFSSAFNWYAAQLSITDINQPARGNQNLFLGAWSNVTQYVPGNEVSQGGNYWSCLVANTNQTPPTPPTTSTYWQNVGPVNLGNLPDGPENFSQTGSGLSYAPTSNPLSALDAGASTTVNVASFVLQTSSKGTVSDNSGSVTGLGYSTLYYIYYSDPTLAGGAVTYQAATTKATALSGTGNFFIGSITTPAVGGTSIGNGDGGAGVQIGAITNSYATSNATNGFTTFNLFHGSVTVTTANSPAAQVWEFWTPGFNNLFAASRVLNFSYTFSMSGTGTGSYSVQWGANTGSGTIVFGSTAASGVGALSLPAGTDPTTLSLTATVAATGTVHSSFTITQIALTTTS